MPADPSSGLLGLEDLLPGALTERLRSLSPGIAWALESFAVSFGAELEHLDVSAREAFARLTLGYGENLDQFMRLAREAASPDQQLERARKMEQLRKLDLFSDLNDFDLGQIAQGFRRITIGQGEVLAEQGAEGTAVYFLESGHVGVIVDGNQVAIRGEGTLFGETSIITGEPVNATLKAVSPCAVLHISREDFVQLVLGLPELVPKIARIGFTRLEEATHRLSEVLGHMPDALLKIDRNGIITGDISSKCFQYLGRDVLTGQRLSEVLFEDEPALAARWEELFPQLLQNPELFHEPEFRIPRGTDFSLARLGMRHYEVNLFPCYRWGVQEGFDVSISDVTDQKRVEEERARMQRALQRRKRKFMLFRLAGERFGVEIEKVRELVEPPSITRIPNAPVYLRGFFNLRGHILPALNLYTLLHLPVQAPDGPGCIFIVDLHHDEKTIQVGLLTDGPDEILEVYDSDITLREDLSLEGLDLDYLQGITHDGDHERVLLDVERLISSEQRRELASLRPSEQ